MHPIRSHRPMNIQVPQGFWNVVFFCCGKDLAPLVPTSLSIPRRGVGREVAIKTVAKKVDYFILHPLLPVFQSCFLGETLSLTFSWPGEILLIIPRIPRHVQLQLHLGIPDPIPTKPGNFPVFLPSPGSIQVCG